MMRPASSAPPLQSGSEAADFADADDPFALFESWFAEASAREPSDPNAMALATVDALGAPNVRIVLLKGLDAPDHARRGFVFYSNAESAKGRELLANPKAALLFHWKSLDRQVRARGAVSEALASEADAYFATRPRDSQIGAWASRQSRPLASRETLERAIADLAAKFEGKPVPRPPHWPGFRLAPVEIEFWCDRPFRLHDRIVFRRAAADAPWTKERLYP